MFEPLINCGYLSGENPECWDGKLFDTEEECEKWIDDNIDNFTPEEAAGGIYAHPYCVIK